MKNDPTTIIAARIKRKNKKLLIELFQAFLIIAAMAAFFGGFWIVDKLVKD